MSDTPRTDEAEFWAQNGTHEEIYAVESSFARELERELRQLHADKERLQSDLEESRRRVYTLERQATESANAFHRELQTLRAAEPMK